jgi:hypothetical protein
MVPSLSLLPSVNWQSWPAVQLGGLNAAVGGWFGGAVGFASWVLLSGAPSSSVMVRVTLYDPAVLYECEGF